MEKQNMIHSVVLFTYKVECYQKYSKYGMYIEYKYKSSKYIVFGYERLILKYSYSSIKYNPLWTLEGFQ